MALSKSPRAIIRNAGIKTSNTQHFKSYNVFLDFYLLVFDFFALGIAEKRRNKLSQFQIRDLQKS